MRVGGTCSEICTPVTFKLFKTFLHTFRNPTPPDVGSAYNWTRFDRKDLNYLSVTDDPKMKVGYHWRGHTFWNRYAIRLDAVDVGNLGLIRDLRNELGDYQLATWVLLSAALFFFAILVSLACYCTRKDSEEEDM